MKGSIALWHRDRYRSGVGGKKDEMQRADGGSQVRTTVHVLLLNWNTSLEYDFLQALWGISTNKYTWLWTLLHSLFENKYSWCSRSIHLNNRSYVKTLNQASQLIYRIQEYVRPVQRGTNMNSFIHQHPAMMLAPVRGVGGCHNYF